MHFVYGISLTIPCLVGGDMGSGGSTRKGSYRKILVRSIDEKEDGTEGVDSGGRLAAGRTSKCCTLHEKSCTDKQLCLATTIRDAFPFNDDKKIVEKRDRLGSFDHTRGKVRGNWGDITVGRLVAKVTCSVCRETVLERSGEQPFYYCTRCRDAGRRFVLCTRCYKAGELATGPREGTSNPKQLTRAKSDLSDVCGVDPSWDRSARAADRLPHHAQTFPQASVECSVAPDTETVPSGLWKGSLVEDEIRRTIERQLVFCGGRVTGSGMEGCSLQGSYTNGKVKWAETHEWGTITVSAAIVQGRCIRGEFTTSDGGKGALQLAVPR